MSGQVINNFGGKNNKLVENAKISGVIDKYSLCVNDKKATHVFEGANMDLTLSVSPCIYNIKDKVAN